MFKQKKRALTSLLNISQRISIITAATLCILNAIIALHGTHTRCQYTDQCHSIYLYSVSASLCCILINVDIKRSFIHCPVISISLFPILISHKYWDIDRENLLHLMFYHCATMINCCLSKSMFVYIDERLMKIEQSKAKEQCIRLSTSNFSQWISFCIKFFICALLLCVYVEIRYLQKVLIQPYFYLSFHLYLFSINKN